MVEQLSVQPVVGPSIQDRINEYHAELADVRFRILCQLLLEAFHHRDDAVAVFLPDLLKDSASRHTDSNEFLEFVVRHGCPRGLGEALDEAVYSVSDSSEPYLNLIEVIESGLSFGNVDLVPASAYGFPGVVSLPQ